MNEWRRDEASGGLYRLYVDGQGTPVTAVVDRGATRAEQLEQLAEVTWPPHYQLALYYEMIVGGAEPKTSYAPLRADRLYSPFGGGETVVDISADEDSVHPLRRYIWPVLDSAGALSLDPSERVLAAFAVGRPRFAFVQSLADGKVGNRALVGEYTEDCWLVLTNQRVVVGGRIVVPPRVRDDYGGMKSFALMFTPGFDELLAASRAGKRERAVEHLRPVTHFRFEFLSGVVKHTREIQAPKPLLAKKPAPRTDVEVEVSIWIGTEWMARLWFQFEGAHAPEGERFCEALVAAVKEFDGGLVLREPETTSKPITPSRIIAIESGMQTTNVWQIEGGMPRSIPADVQSIAPLSVIDAASRGNERARLLER